MTDFGGASTDDGEADRDEEVCMCGVFCVYLMCYRIVWN